MRNAADPATARELVDAILAFDADPEAAVAVLCGSSGTLCAGADLHRVAETREQWNLIEGGLQGPLGPSRLLLSKPVIAAVAGGLELA